MTPQIATVVYAFGILGLFLLGRDRMARTSKALWLAVAWLLINGSRPVSLWLQSGPRTSSPDASVNGNPLDAFIFGTLTAAGLMVLAGRQRQVGAVLRANLPILLFFAYCALSVLWSDDPFVAFKRWIKAAGDIVMVLVVLTDPEPSDAVKRLLARVGFILIPLSILLIKYYPDLAVYYNYWDGRQYVSGVAADKNMLGVICLVLGLGAWWQCLGAYEERKGRERTRRVIAHGAVLAMVIWLFWLADSKSSLSSFILGGGLIAMARRFRLARRPALVHLVVAAVVGVSFSVLFLGIGAAALEAMGRNPTLTGRTDIWRGLLQMSGNPLLGAGFESFWLGNQLQSAMGGLLRGVNEAHNGYLEVFLNLGGIGVALLALLILTGYRNVVVALRREPDAGRFGLALFVIAVVYSFTEAGFRMLSPMWIAFLLAITAVPKGSRARGFTSVRRLAPDAAASECSAIDVQM
jgi:exopolysaccharide production protein ExoQ